MKKIVILGTKISLKFFHFYIGKDGEKTFQKMTKIFF